MLLFLLVCLIKLVKDMSLSTTSKKPSGIPIPSAGVAPAGTTKSSNRTPLNTKMRPPLTYKHLSRNCNEGGMIGGIEGVCGGASDVRGGCEAKENFLLHRYLYNCNNNNNINENFHNKVKGKSCNTSLC